MCENSFRIKDQEKNLSLKFRVWLNLNGLYAAELKYVLFVITQQ